MSLSLEISIFLRNSRLFLLLSDLFSRMVNESDVMENIDAPEAGLDALMQVCLAFLKGQ
jgi:hypothetical protein